MDGDDVLVIILGLILLAMIVSPILAIVAFRAVRRLENQLAARQHAQAFTSGEPLPPQMMDPALIARVYALEQKLAQIESLLSKLSGVPAAEVPAPTPTAERPPVPPPTPAPPPVERPASQRSPITAPHSDARSDLEIAATLAGEKSSFDLEKLIAGRWLMRVGMLLVLIGVAYFLKYAFDNNWIGPAGRVALGLLAGSGLLLLSHFLLKRGYVYFSEGITSLGGGVLYLSLYAAWHYYALVANGVAFLLMIVVTAALLAIAVGRDSQRLAVLGLIGGFLTPVLVSTGRNAQLELFTYVAALDIGLLILTRLRQWRFLEPLAFACTQLYFWGWYDRFYHTEPQLLPTMIFASVFFFIFAVLPAIRNRRTDELFPEQMTVMLANAFIYLIALRAMLWPTHRWTLTIAVLILSAVHLGITTFIPKRTEQDDGQRPLSFLLYAGLALTFATLAIPIRLEGKWITMAWAIEGAVLMWTGFRARLWLLRAAGFILFGITAFRLIFFPIPAERFFFNARFGVYAVTIACFAAALWFAWKNSQQLDERERTAFGALALALNLVTLTALTQEIWLYFSPVAGTSYTPQLEATRLLSLSAFWAIYAAALFAGGLRWELLRVRVQAYLLLAIVAMKVVLADFGEAGDIHFAWPLLNARFVCFTIVLASMLAMIWLARRNPGPLGKLEEQLVSALAVACNVLAVTALSIEVWDFFQPPAGEPYHRDTRLARQLGLSLLWTFYAGALIVTGVRRQQKGLRYQALALFGITIAKVFFFDLGFLSGFYRIMSSLGLGIVLLVVAFLYQKFVTRPPTEASP